MSKDNKQKIIATFSEKFRKLVGDEKQIALAKEFGVSGTTMTRMLHGEALPNTVVLAQIAEKYQVSTDELLGIRSDDSYTYADFLKFLDFLVRKKGCAHIRNGHNMGIGEDGNLMFQEGLDIFNCTRLNELVGKYEAMLTAISDAEDGCVSKEVEEMFITWLEKIISKSDDPIEPDPIEPDGSNYERWK